MESCGSSARVPDDEEVDLADQAGGDKQLVGSRRWVVFGAMLVAGLYSLPLVEGFTHQGHLPHIFYFDEMIYAARVVDAYRGGTLGSPYIAGHEDAPRYIPELAERSLALAAHATGLAPLTLLAASRVVFPVLIFLLLWDLALALGIEPHLAVLGAACAPLFPPLLTILQPPGEGTHGFLRLFRLVTPAPYLFLLLLGIRAVLAAWITSSLRMAALAGLALSLLFHTPLYYWSFAFGGTALLAAAARGPRRRALALSLAMAAIIGTPVVVRSALLLRVPEVIETLNRHGLMAPSRWPESVVPRRFLENLLILVPLWIWRRRVGRPAQFLIPFLATGGLLLLQNAVTGRQLQAFHWMHCLFLVWPIAAVALWQQIEGGRTVWTGAFAACVIAGALFVQLIAYESWEALRQEQPELYALTARMPRTLLWLERHTGRNSVMLASEDVMNALVLYTHNKVYWSSAMAAGAALSDREAVGRFRSAEGWEPGLPLPFRSDFYLGLDGFCRRVDVAGFVYQDAGERTCLVALP